MPRPQYPSDEGSRKTKPAARVHTSVTNHPRYAHVFQNPTLRGIVIGIWVKAIEKFASKTGDVLTLTISDVIWITGTVNAGAAASVLKRICRLMDYRLVRVDTATGGEAVEVEGDVTRDLGGAARSGRHTEPSETPPVGRLHRGGVLYRVTIRNFSKKQGLTPRSVEHTPHTPPPSESESESDSESESNNPPVVPPEGRGDAERSALIAAAGGNGNGKAPHAEPEAEKLPRAKGEAFVYPDAFERAWQKRPRRAGNDSKGSAYEEWRRTVNSGVKPEALEKLAERYASFCRAEGIEGTEKVMQAERLFRKKNRNWEQPFLPSKRRALAPDALPDYQPIRGGAS